MGLVACKTNQQNYEVRGIYEKSIFSGGRFNRFNGHVIYCCLQEQYYDLNRHIYCKFRRATARSSTATASIP